MVTYLRLAPAATRTEALSDAPSIRVVLADDHELMRHSLRQLLDGDAGVQVVAEASDQAQAIKLSHDRRPHVLVLDLRLQGGSSLETLAVLRGQAPDTRVVITTMEISPAFAQRAFEVGAAGFVAKDLADSELIDAVRTVAGGGRYAGPRVAHMLRPLLAASL